MKRLLAIFALAALLFGGCSKSDGSASAGGESSTLSVWAFTEEVWNMSKYFTETHPDITIEYSYTPTDQFPNKLDPVLASGQGAPDVFALEIAFVRRYIESGLLLDITDIYEANKDKLIKYPVEIGSYNGRVYGMSWQAAPGAVYYKRSLAKKYFGTDEPAEIQKHFTDLDTFLETAQFLKETSGGSCVIVARTTELFRPIMAARNAPWVVDGKLNVDPAAIQYMEMAKTLRDNGYEARAEQSENWYSGMQGNLKDEMGNDVEVFSYFLPTWGINTLRINAPETAGDWAVIRGPVPYYSGGTWLGAYKDTKNVDAAKEFIRYLATDEGFLEAWATDTGDFVSNMDVINKIKDNFSEAFLGGQNHYAEFAEMAMYVDGRLAQDMDQAIEGIFNEAVAAYVNGEKTMEQALEDFRAQASYQLGI